MKFRLSVLILLISISNYAITIKRIDFTPEKIFSRSALKERLSSLSFYSVTKSRLNKRFKGVYYRHFKPGKYHCVVCSSSLFRSEDKFLTRDGFPVFNRAKGNVIEIDPPEKLSKKLHYRKRKPEARCKVCGAYLGMIYNEAPDSGTGVKYLINSSALKFKPDMKLIK